MKPAADTQHWPETARARLQALLQAMPDGQNHLLYGIADTAYHPPLYQHLMQEPAQSQVCCLYDGMAAMRYARIAPYLFVFNAASPLTLHWLTQGWGQPWGLFMAATVLPEQLKRHLKKFLQVKVQNKVAHFRFYDPRVLPAVLAVWGDDEVHSFFHVHGASSMAAVICPHGEREVTRYTASRLGLLTTLAGAWNLDVRTFPQQSRKP